MKNQLFCNIAIVVILGLFNCFISRGVQIFPFDDLVNDDFNPFNAMLNMDNMAKEMMSIFFLNKYQLMNQINIKVLLSFLANAILLKMYL